jgi:hypothetical protein
MIKGSINLAAFEKATILKMGKTQVDCIVIPLEANDLKMAGDKGGVYLNIVAFPMKELKEYATHIIKQSVSKEQRESGIEKPILGNLDVRGQQSAAADKAPTVAASEDDLPF